MGTSKKILSRKSNISDTLLPMSTLLLKLVCSRTLNGTVFPAMLFIYNDIVVYRKRGLIHIKEMTISYNHIAHVIIDKIPFFAHLEILTTGEDKVTLRFVNLKAAERAKKILDQKIYYSHAKHSATERQQTSLSAIEKTIVRYKELLEKGFITKAEFDKRTTQALKGF